MNTDDDEELLLLRIKALKSTPRVNIRVEFSSDNDARDVSVIDIKKKKKDKYRASSSGSEKEESSPLKDDEDNDEDNDLELREIALRSLRRSSSSSLSRCKSVTNADGELPLVEVSVGSVPPATTSASCQAVTASTVVRRKELCAIQHHLISSTSGEHSQAPNTSHIFEDNKNNEQTVESNSTLSKQAASGSDTKVKSTCAQAVLSISCTQFTVATDKTCAQLTVAEKTDIVCSNPSNDAETSIIPSAHIDTPFKTSKESDNSAVPNGDHSDNMGNTSLKVFQDIHVSQLQDNPFTRGNEKVHCGKSVIHNKLIQDDLKIKGKSSSTTPGTECEYTDGKLSRVELHADIITSPIASPHNFETYEELGAYSPSSPSEIDNDEIEEENNNNDNEEEEEVEGSEEEKPDELDDYNDYNETFDAISLCTSEKDENEFDSISFEYNTYNRKHNNNDNHAVNENNNCKTAKPEKGGSHCSVPAGRNSNRVNIVKVNIVKVNRSFCNSTSKTKTVCKQSEGHAITNVYKTAADNLVDIQSDTSGLNSVLDRYLDEVAASKNNSKLKSVSNGSCSNEAWMDCEPGPSGYIAPTVVHGFYSESEDSCVETTVNKCEDSCIETTTAGEGRIVCSSTGTDSKRGLQGDMLDSSSNDGKRDDLKDVTCAICLGAFDNRSFLNLCFHSFCHMCIIQWSELSRLCPLCKTKYSTLIHSVNTDLDYETYEFANDLPEEEGVLPPQRRREFSETMEDGRRFRYRSTVVDSDAVTARRAEREQAEQESSTAQQQRKMKRRLKWSAIKDRRKAVYAKGLQIKEVKQRGKKKIRDISPKFFEDNPALKHRLVPWLLRDLNVLLGNKDEDIRFVMALVLNLISKVALGGEVFKEQLRPFLFDSTNHFVAELVSFATSPYDIQGYDSNVRYHQPKDVIITSTYTPAIEVSDGEDDRLLNEILIGGEPENSALGEGANEPIYQNISPPGSSDEDGDDDDDGDDGQEVDVNSISILPEEEEVMMNNQTDNFSLSREIHDITTQQSHAIAVDEDTTVATMVMEKVYDGVDGPKKTSNDERSGSDESSGDEQRKRRKHVKKVKKKKKKKRKQKHSDGGKAAHKRTKSKRRKVSKAGDKEANASESSDESHHESNEDKENQPSPGKNTHPENPEAAQGKDTVDTQLNISKQKTAKVANRLTKRKNSELKRKRKHKKGKHEKHKRKRKNSSQVPSEDSSSSSEEESEAEKRLPKQQSECKMETPRKKKHDNTDEVKTQHKTHSKQKQDCQEENTEKRKAVKRKSDSSGGEDLPKKKKKDSDSKIPEKNSGKNSDFKTKRKKKERKKKRKHHKHRKGEEEKKVQPVPTPTKTNVGTATEEEALDKELQCKIEHAIDTIMASKGIDDDDDDDEFLNSQEVQDLLSRGKCAGKLDLIKDGDGYKTRAEVVRELLLIEKAITRRKEKKQKQKQIKQNLKSNSNNIETVIQSDNNKKEKLNADTITDKAIKKAEREKSYKVLFKELQEIEGRINCCRSSLQGKPSDII